MTKNPSLRHVLAFTLLYFKILAVAQSRVDVNIGVVLDLEKWVGKMGLSCIQMALSDFYDTHAHYRTRILLHSRDSYDDVVGTALAVLDLIKNVEVQAILGPITSMQAAFVINVGQKAQIPIMSFSATSSALTVKRSDYFFRVTVNDSSQVTAISALVQAFGWREAVPIYVDNEYGESALPYLIEALQEVNVKVPYRSVISPLATDDQIALELYKLMTMETRVFIVDMIPPLSSCLFAKAKEMGMMSAGYVWIIANGLTELMTMEPLLIDSMQGVLGVEPYVPETKKSEAFRVRWKKKFQQDNPDIADPELNVYGLWAYDAAVSLAKAIEKAGATNLVFRKANMFSNATDFGSLKVSINGPNLLQALSKTSFNGLTGKFSFVNGQLQSSGFQIMNVIGNGSRRIGFWTPTRGLVKHLNSSPGINSYSNTPEKPSLETITWPGNTVSVPKGWDWEIPTKGKKLKIGVPVKDGFREFVNTATGDGYCIEVFKAAVKELPYALSYEFIPFVNSSGQMNGTYDDLIHQVYLGSFDAVVGDTTIIYRRTNEVDFTLPYTESGVRMVVPIRDNESKNAWVFLKPLTWDLWFAIFCFFVFIGFVVWVLEHRINEDFRGPPSHQVGTSFSFSLATMVFAHKERVVSNLARVVVVIWCFVVLILTQAYTASLTSLLTVQQLQPTVTDVEKLIKNGEYVGLQEGTFIEENLKNLGFNPNNFRKYTTPEQCDELLQKGSKNGGISAAFDEVPYMKRFLASRCSKYTMIEPPFKTDGFGPSFKTDGFGFVFPRGSPLVPDVSRAILKVIEGETIKRIERAAFEQLNCVDAATSLSSSSQSLGLNSFWGLFLIVGIAALAAFFIFAAKFVYEHGRVLRASSSDSELPFRRRVLNLLRIYNQKDLNSHTFRKNELNDKVVLSLPPSAGAPSPSAWSLRTDFPDVRL